MGDIFGYIHMVWGSRYRRELLFIEEIRQLHILIDDSYY
jgi:hypothetical protein